MLDLHNVKSFYVAEKKFIYALRRGNNDEKVEEGLAIYEVSNILKKSC
jgi:hypothetical protein